MTIEEEAAELLKLDYEKRYEKLLKMLTIRWNETEAYRFLEEHPPISQQVIEMTLFL